VKLLKANSLLHLFTMK